MGDSVERALEETVPIMQAAKRVKLLNSYEIDEVVRKRRHYEYALINQKVTRSDFLKYASFERELANLLQKRADRRNTKKKAVQLIVGKTSSRVNLVYSRAVKAFRGDVDLWLHYARHCVKTGTTRTAQKVLSRAIAYRGDSERVWLAAVALHFDTCGDANGARSLAQRALRAMPDSIDMWQEYFRVEVCFLSKLIIRRIAIGMSPTPESGTSPSEPTAVLRPSLNQDIQKNTEVESDAAKIDHKTAAVGESDDELNSDNDDDNDSIENIDETSDSDDVVNIGSIDDIGNTDKDNRNIIANNNGSDKESDGQDDDNNDSDLADASAVADIEGDGVGGETDNQKSSDEAGLEPETAAEASSGESSSENDEDSPAGKTLSFWEGGVPFAVFKEACEKAKLNAQALFKFWETAVSSPYVPSQLLAEMSNHIRSQFPQLLLTKLIAGRVSWDCANAKNERILVLKDRKVPAENSSLTLNGRQQELAAEATLALSRIKSILQQSNYPESERQAALSCLQNLREQVGGNAETKSLVGMFKTLSKDFDLEMQKSSENKADKSGNNADQAQASIGEWSFAKLKRAVGQGKDASGAWKEGDVVSGVREQASVPFRGLEPEQVICQYLNQEDNVEDIRAVSDVLLATPPITMQILRTIIDAELRLLERKDTASNFDISKKSLTRLRELFAKAEALSGAKHDVEFWLLFLDFERRKARDSRAAAAVHAKALRRLDDQRAQLFTELQTLRNLG